MDQDKKADQGKKKRAENWTPEEKDILRQVISQSAHILEDKSTKTNINILKAKEWKNISAKLNEITTKNRSEAEIKLAWKRMKMTAKANISAHRQEQMRTGGGEKPPSPSPEDLAVMAITPLDFVVKINDYDSDAALVHDTTTKLENPVQYAAAGSSNQEEEEGNIECILTNVGSEYNVEQALTKTRINSNTSKGKKSTRNGKEKTRDTIIESNINFKKRHLEMLETEHIYNIEIAKLKIRKLNLEIEILESQKK